MNIKTKFKIGDTVWTVKDNKAYSFFVKKLEIIENNKWSIVVYYCDEERDICFKDKIQWDTRKYRENRIVWSREELINLL